MSQFIAGVPCQDDLAQPRLEEVLTTAELARRPSRPPNYEAECRALTALVAVMADSPGEVLQRLVDCACQLTGAGSAGMSLLDSDGGERSFRWAATSGELFPLTGSRLPRDFSPCGVVLDRNATQLMTEPRRFYPYIGDIRPQVCEVLLVPFHRGEKPIGTVWVVSHSQEKRFDAEDARLVSSLSRFASAAAQTLSSLAEMTRSKEALRDSEDRYRQLVQLSPDAIFVNSGGTIVFANGAMVRLFGATSEQQIVGRTVGELVDANSRSVVETAIKQMAANGSSAPPVAQLWRRLDGSPLPVEAAAAPIQWHRQEAIQVVLRDESERTRADVIIQESQARFRVMADTLPQMVWVTLPDGYHEYYNRRWYEFTGVAEGSTDGEGWNGMFHPDDQEAAWTQWRHSLATGEPYEIEYRLRHHSGGYRWTLGRALPIRNEAGQIERWFGTCTDIDALKRLTDEREQLLERERVARAEAEASNLAKDRFLAVLSHELRTPLSPVVMTIPAMEMDPELPYKFREDLAMVRRNIDLEVKLIDDLLDLSRITSGKLKLQMQPVRVHEQLLHVIHSSAGDASSKRLSVRHDLQASDDRITGDPGRLQQVFWNLLRNAIKFTPEGGQIAIATRDAQENGHVVVTVRDSGVGIPPELLPRVFDAFEQGGSGTTRQFGGLGLGLAIAKAVVEMHGGTIAAASAGTGLGASFTLGFRTASSRQSTESATSKALQVERHPAAPCRVLLVEDHADTARTMARLLGSAGLSVVTAGSVASALQLAASQPFDIVVSDIGLPDATGYELMQQLKDRYATKGIALSGYGMEGDIRQSLESGFVEHVVKPVDIAHLVAVIRRVVADTTR